MTVRGSRFRALRYTPLRDLLRGRVTARLDPLLWIRESGLPRSLAELVTTVVRRTRLRRGEKTDVARELVAHFEDAVEGGDDAASIAAAFGDPRLAARLIRRAKKRQRGPIHKALVGVRRTLGAVLLIAILWYAWAALRFYTAEPNVAIDYVARLNEPALALPEEDRAWPLYREAYLAIPIEVLARNPNADEDFRWAKPGDEAWPRAVAAVESIQSQLGLVREASRKPALGYVYGAGQDPDVFRHRSAADRFHSGVPASGHGEPSPPRPSAETPLIEIMLDQLGPLRELAILLQLDARVAAERGDAERVFEDLAALVRLGAHADGPTLIEQLVHVSITVVAARAINEALHAHSGLLLDAHLTDLAHSLAAGPDLKADFDGERAMFYDFVQRLYSDDGSGGGRLCAEGFRSVSVSMPWVLDPAEFGPGPMAVDRGLTGPAFAAINAPRGELIEKYEHFLRAGERLAARPLWEYDQVELPDLDAFADDNVNKVRYWLVTIMLPASGRIPVNFEIAAQQRDATLVAIALELYKRRNGHYPASLDDLVPTFLPAVPPDRYTGKPLSYRLDGDGKPIVYSVGIDRDDDGGRPTVDQHGKRNDNPGYSGWSKAQADGYDECDGDWILFPPNEDD